MLLVQHAYVGLVAALLVLSFPAWLLITQLCIFHAQLRREGITTYEYIIREQMRSSEESSVLCTERARAISVEFCSKDNRTGKSNAVPTFGAAPGTVKCSEESQEASATAIPSQPSEGVGRGLTFIESEGVGTSARLGSPQGT